MKLQLLAGGALVALLAGCGSDPIYYGAPYYYTAEYDRGYYRDRYAYDDFRVTSIEVGGELYRVTVRTPNGRYETYVMESLGSVRVGDRVRLDNGRIYPIG